MVKGTERIIPAGPNILLILFHDLSLFFILQEYKIYNENILRSIRKSSLIILYMFRGTALFISNSPTATPLLSFTRIVAS